MKQRHGFSLIELMVSSDNVLRGGLTTKHVDVDALLDAWDPEPAEPQRTVLEGPASSWSPVGSGFHPPREPRQIGRAHV